MKFPVKYLFRSVVVEHSEDTSVLFLKKELQEIFNIPVGNQRLEIEGKEMLNCHQLWRYKEVEGNQVMLKRDKNQLVVEIKMHDGTFTGRRIGCCATAGDLLASLAGEVRQHPDNLRLIRNGQTLGADDVLGRGPMIHLIIRYFGKARVVLQFGAQRATFEVMTADTVSRLKELAQEKFGVGDVRLFLKSRALADDDNLLQAKVQHLDVVTVRTGPCHLSLVVRYPGGRTAPLRVLYHRTVGEVAELVAKECGVDRKRFELQHDLFVLPDWLPLFETQLEDGDVVELRTALRRDYPADCAVCYVERSSHLFPCGHLCLCAACAYKVSRCPVCRVPGSTIKIYF